MHQVVVFMYNQLKGRFVVIWSFIHEMHFMAFLVSPHGGILGLLFAAVRLCDVRHLPPLQMTHSWCSSIHDEPLDGINGEQDIVFSI